MEISEKRSNPVYTFVFSEIDKEYNKIQLTIFVDIYVFCETFHSDKVQNTKQFLMLLRNVV